MSLKPSDIFVEKKNIKKKINIKNYIENNAKTLKNEYLYNCSRLEKKKIFKKEIYNYFNVFDGHNLWEMSKIKEKSNLKSRNIFVAIKFLAIKKIINEYKPDKIYLNINYIEENILIFLMKKKIKVISENINEKKDFKFLKFLFKLVSFNLKNLILKLYIQFSNKEIDNLNKKDIVFFGYFAHYKIYKKKFIFKNFSNLELNLKKNLNFKKELIFIPSKKIKSLNSKKITNSNLNFLNNYLKLKDKFKIIFLYYFYTLKFFFLKSIISNSLNNELNIFFKIHSKDYYDSFCGDDLIDNLIWIKVFENYFSKIKKIKLGIFFIENQPWEKAMIRAWKKYGHGQLVAYTPTTVNFWHMYNFDLTKNKNFLANFLFVSSSAAFNFLKKQSYIKRVHIKKVETLISKIKKKIIKKKKQSILILGDLDNKNNNKIISIVKKIKFFKNYKIFFKPHPHDMKNYLISNVILLNKDLDKIKNDYKFIISASSTSAVLDFFDKGNKICIFDDEKDLNLSPLRHMKYPFFFRDEIDLEKIVRDKKFINNKNLNRIKNYYFHNDKLLIWKKYIYNILRSR